MKNPQGLVLRNAPLSQCARASPPRFPNGISIRLSYHGWTDWSICHLLTKYFILPIFPNIGPLPREERLRRIQEILSDLKKVRELEALSPTVLPALRNIGKKLGLFTKLSTSAREARDGTMFSILSRLTLHAFSWKNRFPQTC